jgi:hypothetical protein
MAFLYKEVSGGGNGLSGEDKAILISRLKELEQAAFDLKGQDRRAYNQLLRHTAFNLKVRVGLPFILAIPNSSSGGRPDRQHEGSNV